MNLNELLIKYPYLNRYYNVLKDHLPNPEEVEVFKLEDVENFGFKVRETVFACAIPPNKLFFKQIPPSTRTFVHELIHLCRKPANVEEEVYAYNLVDAVVFCADHDVKGDPFKLFSLSKTQILEVLREFGFESFEEFYMVVGVIPHIYKVDLEKLELEEWVSERDEVIVFITEIVSGLHYDSFSRKVFVALMELCK